MKYRRSIRTPDRRESQRFYDRLREHTHEKTDVIQMGNEWYVSRQVWDKLKDQVKPANPSEPPLGLSSFSGVPITVSNMLPYWTKKPSQHRQRYNERVKSRRQDAKRIEEDFSRYPLRPERVIFDCPILDYKRPWWTVS